MRDINLCIDGPVSHARKNRICIAILESSNMAPLVQHAGKEPHEIARLVFGSDLPYAYQLTHLKTLALDHIKSQITITE